MAFQKFGTPMPQDQSFELPKEEKKEEKEAQIEDENKSSIQPN